MRQLTKQEDNQAEADGLCVQMLHGEGSPGDIRDVYGGISVRQILVVGIGSFRTLLIIRIDFHSEFD